MPAARAGAAWAPISEARLDLGDAVRFRGGLGFLEQGGALAIAGQHEVDQALRPVGRLLGQPADGGAGRARETAMLDGDVARNGAKEGGFSGAVAPDEPDPGAVGNLRRRPLDQEPAGHAQRHIVDHQHGVV